MTTKERLDFFNKCLDLNFEKFEDIDWNDINLYYNNPLSLGFLSEFANELNWSYVAKYTYISQEKVMRFKNFMDWNAYLQHTFIFVDTLIEIVTKIDNVDWDIISKYAYLNTHFIKLYYNKLNVDLMKENEKLQKSDIIFMQDLLLQEKELQH
jgi:hypothetical protein